MKREDASSLIDKLTRVRIRELVLLALALHLFAIAFPQDGKVFDEAYYVPAAIDLLEGRVSNIEHPFMGKMWAALGIAIFGNHWFGWRIFYVVLSVSSLYVFYKLSTVFLTERLSVYCTALLAFETMFFVHGSLALLDVPAIFFGLAGMYLYLSRRPFLSAVMLGLSILNKETGVLFVLLVVIYHLVAKLRSSLKLRNIRTYVKPLVFISILLVVVLVPMTVYDVLYEPKGDTWIVEEHEVRYIVSPDGLTTSTTTITTHKTMGRVLNNAFEHISYILNYASSLTVTDESKVEAGNYAWNWILPIPTPYQPSGYYVVNVNKTVTTMVDSEPTGVSWTIVHPIAWYGVGNMPIWWTIWIIVPFGIFNVVRRRADDLDIFILTWVAVTYVPMLYLSLVVNRIVYPFYFLYTVPILCLAFPRFIKHTSKEPKATFYILATYLVVVLWFFFNYFPVNVFAQ